MYYCRVCGGRLVEARPPVFDKDGNLVVVGMRSAYICPVCRYVILEKRKPSYRQEKWCSRGHAVVGFDGFRCPVHNTRLRIKPRRAGRREAAHVLGGMGVQAQAVRGGLSSGGADR